MKNIVEEKPQDKISGRLKKSSIFVDQSDIKNKDILDIGCGYGWFEVYSFDHGAKNVIGIEITQEDLRTVSEHIKNANFSSKIGSAIKIPLPDNSVDTVVAWEVIEHIPKNTEIKMFKEVQRVLRSGGAFYLSTPYHHIASTPFDPAYWLVGHRHYSLKKLVTLAGSGTLFVEKFSVVGGWFTVLSVLNMYISKWIFRRSPFFNQSLKKKVDKEYGRDGFYNIFVKYRKL